MTQPAAPAAPTLADWAGLTLLGLIWGSSFMLITIATRELGPFTIAAGRIAIGALGLLALARLMHLPLPAPRGPAGRRLWLFAAGLGFFSMALPFFLLSWGQARVPSGFAGVSMAMSPLLTMVLAHFLIPGERITGARLLGIALGFAGVVLLIGGEALGSTGTPGEGLARLACAGAAASYAVGAIITRRAPACDPIAFATIATVIAAALIVPAALIAEGLPTPPSTTTIAAIAYLGLVPTALANLLLVALIRSAGPNFIALVNYQVPVWSVLFGWAFLAEELPRSVLVALALILAGVAFTQWRARRKPVIKVSDTR